MKSNWPSVAHCARTVAPSCSISLLTSRMRCGLFLTVCTPSAVSVDSMMYVGTRSPPLLGMTVALRLAQGCTRYARRAAVPTTVVQPLRSISRVLAVAALTTAVGATGLDSGVAGGAPAAATLALDRPCYDQSTPAQRIPLQISGTGFQPNEN